MSGFYKFFILSALVFLLAETSNAQEISSKEAMQMIKDSLNVLILDVRTEIEYSEGHLESSIHIDYMADTFKEKVSQSDKGKLYLVYCRSGNRSRKAQSIMKELGFERVYNLESGIISWKAEEYPIVK